MSGLSKSLRVQIERATGEKIEDLQRMSIAERRRMVEKQLGHRLTFKREFPFIGRGNVLRKDVLTHSQVEREFLRAIR